jgi:3'-phosphoadenosine 5'-phosphosulfate sulfotransferase (PAPS reductase)/FAD synthetase
MLYDYPLDQWELIISEVNKTDVPLECIKKIVLKLSGGKQRTVNIHTLIKQGLALEEIEALVTRTFRELDEDIRDVDFVVDIKSVAALVQPETDKILGRL